MKTNANHSVTRVIRSRRSATTRAGFSLLEVLLTMAMAVVLMGMIGWAFQFYTRDMNGAHLEVQQTQLASAIMQMIEDDLRATLHPEQIDMAPLEAVLSAQGGTNSAAQNPALSAAGVTASTTTTPVADPATSSTTILQTPGLIGGQFQIQIDVSRLPRLEEYTQMFDQDSANIEDVPSDLKTVTYYVQEPGAGVTDPLDAIINTTTDQNELTGGLVRRVLDRAVTTYAAETGNLNQLAQTGQILAPEVVSIEFQYYDGIIWQLEWSSDELEELPLAIRIDLSMASTASQFNSADLGEDNATRVFTHIVRLPMAKLIEEEDSAATSATTGTATTGTAL